MKNFIQSGDVIEYTPTENPVFSGEVAVIGERIGVAVADILPGQAGALRVRGVVELPKAAGAEIAIGAAVGWDGQAIVAGGGAPAGYAAAPAAADAATVRVNLNA